MSGARKNSISDRRRSNAFSLGGNDQGPLLDPEYLKNLEEETKKPDKAEISNQKIFATQPKSVFLPKKSTEEPKPNTPKSKLTSKKLLKAKEIERAEKIEQANKALYEDSAPSNEKNLQGKHHFYLYNFISFFKVSP